MYDELIERLRRDATAFTGFIMQDLTEAADAIENLSVVGRAQKTIIDGLVQKVKKYEEQEG